MYLLLTLLGGAKGLLLSSRNSSRASEHLMTATGCSKLLYTRERERQVSGIVENGNRVEIFEIPPLWDIYSSDTTDAFMQEGFGDPDDRVAIYIHTSGTTGK